MFSGPVWNHSVTLDYCTTCQLIWFDGGEMDRLKKSEPPNIRSAKLKPGLFRLVDPGFAVDENAGGVAARFAVRKHERASTWTKFVTFLGLPVRERQASAHGWSLLSTLAGASCLLVGILDVLLGGSLIGALGFVPAEPFRWGGLTLLTSFFVHDSLLYLFFNVYFLIVFGDAVQKETGSLRFSALSIAVLVCGGAVESFMTPEHMTPSGSAHYVVAALMAFHVFAHPFDRVVFAGWKSRRNKLPEAQLSVGPVWSWFGAWLIADVVLYVVLNSETADLFEYLVQATGLLIGGIAATMPRMRRRAA